jgi:hypothetical protein
MYTKSEKASMQALLSNMIFDGLTFKLYTDCSYGYGVAIDTYLNLLFIDLTLFTQDCRYIRSSSKHVAKQLIQRIQEVLDITTKPDVEYDEVFPTDAPWDRNKWFRECHLIYKVDEKFIENINALCKMNKGKQVLVDFPSGEEVIV